jgi:large conductance mechanosensitive channel
VRSSLTRDPLFKAQGIRQNRSDREPVNTAAAAGEPPEGAMLEEFKKFVLRGNVVDLAVGVVIGVAFGAIVSSLVADIFMPIIGAITGGLDFSNYFIRLSRSVTAESLAEAKKQGAVLAYGNFITVVINFLIIAACLFVAVRLINRLKAEEAEKPAPPLTKTEELLQDIRDLLAKKA